MRYGTNHKVKPREYFGEAVRMIQVYQLKIAGALSPPSPTSDLPSCFAQATCNKSPQNTLRTYHKNTTGSMHKPLHKPLCNCTTRTT